MLQSANIMHYAIQPPAVRWSRRIASFVESFTVKATLMEDNRFCHSSSDQSISSDRIKADDHCHLKDCGEKILMQRLKRGMSSIKMVQSMIQRRAYSSENNHSIVNNTAETPTQLTFRFLQSLGYSDEVSNGVIDALLKSGIQANSLLTMAKTLAGRYEVGEDGGLEALAASVQADLQEKVGKSKVKIWCVPSTGWSPARENDSDQRPNVHSMEKAFAVEALEGSTLTDIVKYRITDNSDILGEYLECACSGIMACSTCHVVIHPDWYDARLNHSSDPKKVCAPSEAEMDMIDLAHEPQVTSRLGCQVIVTKYLDGLIILLPGGANNLMDFIPFNE